MLPRSSFLSLISLFYGPHSKLQLRFGSLLFFSPFIVSPANLCFLQLWALSIIVSFNRFPSSPSVTSLFSTAPGCHLKPPPPPPHSPTRVALPLPGLFSRLALSQPRFCFVRRLDTSCCSQPVLCRDAHTRKCRQSGQQTTLRDVNVFVAPPAVRAVSCCAAGSRSSAAVLFFFLFFFFLCSPCAPIFSLQRDTTCIEEILCRM